MREILWWYPFLCSKPLSVINTTDNSTDSIVQTIITLSSDILKYVFIHVNKIISDLPYLKNPTVALEIASRWGKDTIEEELKYIS